MTSFQERFKGKTTTISKEGVIQTLEKPPIPQGYIQKEFTSQSLHTTNNSNSKQSMNLNNNANSSRGSQQTKQHITSNSPMSKQYVSGSNITTPSNITQTKEYGNNGFSDGQVINRQQQSNSNFSQKSEQSYNSKASINQKQNDPYFVQNPFDLDLNSLNSANINGYQQQQLQKGGSNFSQQQYNNSKNMVQGINYSESNNGSQSVKNSASSSNIRSKQNTVQNSYDIYSNITSDNTLQSSNMKYNQQQSSNYIFSTKLNTYTYQYIIGQSNVNSATNQSPYHNYNPYTLEAIENIDQKLPQRGKASTSPDVRRYNNRVLQQQSNNMSNQEYEASQYVQTYVPSFTQHTVIENKEQEVTKSSLNSSKKSQFGNDYIMAQQQRGGLGANTGTEEWNQKKEKQDKMQEYSAQVKYFNQAQQSSLPPSNQRRPKQKEEEKKISTREKALEFSKNIPKPRQKGEKIITEQSEKSLNQQQNYEDTSSKSNMTSNNNTTTTKTNYSHQTGVSNPYESDIDQLEKQHLEYLNKIQSLKLNS